MGALRRLAVTTCVVLSAVSAACDGKGAPPSASATSSPAVTTSAPNPSSTDYTPPPERSPGYEQLCSGLSWPRPLPAVVGSIFDEEYEFGQFACLLGVRAVAPDGRVLYEQGRHVWGVGPERIVSVSPPPDTPVGRTDPVTVNVVFEDSKTAAPSGYRPCDWVSTAEAENFLGKAPMHTETTGDVTGSTKVACHYSSQDDSVGVGSWLSLVGAHVIDAETEFEFKMAHGNASVSSVNGLGIKAACASVNHPAGAKNALWAVLSGERIYIANDDGTGGESCDTLKQFAQAAIRRIGG
jgi:hypothetical protein